MRARDDAAYGQRPAGTRPSGEDPLAELARLIGQEDPFAEFFRENNEAPTQSAPAQRTARPAAPAPRPPAHAPVARAEPARPYVRQEPVRQEPVRHEPARHEPMRHESPRQDSPRQDAQRPSSGAFSALAAEAYAEPIPRQGEPRARGEHRDLHREPVRPAARPGRDDAPRAVERNPLVSDRAAEAVAEALGQSFAMPAAQSAPAARTQPAAPSRDTTFREMSVRTASAPAERAEPQHQPQPRGGFTLDDDAYDYGRTAVERDSYDDRAPEELDDGYEAYEYEDERPPRSRRQLMLGIGVAAVILLAAGGYFGLRAMSGGGSAVVASGQPPVIKADHAPNKVAPPQPSGGEQGADGQKLIYDRVGGDPSGNERVVSSQEEPVDPSQAAQPQAAPRVILPPTGGAGPAPSPSAPAPLGAMPSGNPPAAQPSAAPANPASTEPKRVRTLTVRADGTVVDGSSAPVLQPPGAPSAQMTAQAPAPIGAPTQVSSYAQDDASSSMPANVPLPPTRVAAAPIATPAPAPATPAADSAASSGYFVQVAAQRTQGEAQSAWRATQSKFPGILGNYSANIRRADLGDRGIYYRAQVGPFNSKDQANELCQSLRAQGGDCMVQRN